MESKKIRIWFNHFFSAVYHIINMMKKGDSNLEIIASSDNPLAVYKTVSDEFYIEDKELKGDEYVDFCISFCKEHKIDVFVPYFSLLDIIKRKDEFEKIGVKLFANTYLDHIDILEDKAKSYRYIQEFLPEIIPPYVISSSYQEFLSGVELLMNQGYRVSYKLVDDCGARSFRVIDSKIETISSLYEKPGSKVTFETAKKVMETYDFNIPVLIMPYLSGVEVSADCLKMKNGNIIIPRYKNSKRFSEVKYDEQIVDYCNRILEKLNVDMPVNIQFKYLDDVPYFLEINPRLSGGIQLSCLGSQINLPLIALNKLIKNQDTCEIKKFKSHKVVHIETPVCLE